MQDTLEVPDAGDFDAILSSEIPQFSPVQALAIASRTFEVHADSAEELGSERDQTFRLIGSGGTPLAIMKVSNAAERPDTLDMEALAVLHVRTADPSLPVAIPWRVPDSERDLSQMNPDDVASAYRAAFEHADGLHHVRMYDVLPGRARADPRTLSDAAIADWGEMTARLARSLRGFFHPAAQRTMLWDVQHALRTRRMLPDIPDPARRALVAQVLDRFESMVLPTWPTLRAQVIHTDFTIDNALVDDDGRITGIVDFGDASYSALVVDLASVIDSLANGRDPEDLFRIARLILDGYQRVTPLEPLELAIIGELFATRCAVTIAVPAWRAARGLEDAAFAERYTLSAERIARTVVETGWDETARRLAGPGAAPTRIAPGAADRDRLIERRERVLGPALEPLTYEDPLQLVDARGVWLVDTEGRRFLDAYNNVPCVGHGHPRVTEAIARQARRLNTNLRYLNELPIELAERLAATCPPELDTVLFVNSGSEANDLAWRMATVFTGNDGGLCTTHAYHGVSAASAALSPESWLVDAAPGNIERWRPPDAYRGTDMDATGFAAAIARLTERGHAPAATILDGVLTSEGFPAVPSGYVADLVRQTHAAGGLWIADEVQGGHGRTGDHLWSFERFGITPDFVTLGKPMGNGHPVAAVITRREIAERFGRDTVFFSTFGGNPVSAAAALAVLDVIDDERVLDRVAVTGQALRAAIGEVARRHAAIGDVRGVGLAIGIEIVREDDTKTPDAARTRAIKEGMRLRGVLVGTTGAADNVLKVRPPLAFTTDEVEPFTQALDQALGATQTHGAT